MLVDTSINSVSGSTDKLLKQLNELVSLLNKNYKTIDWKNDCLGRQVIRDTAYSIVETAGRIDLGLKLK